MNSEPDEAVNQILPSRAPGLRLQMNQTRDESRCVDGGWWPHSYDAAAEFPPLIAALRQRIGPVERVGYDLDSWHGVTGKQVLDEQLVRFEGFHTVFAHLVTVIAADRTRLILLVVPPDADEAMGRAALGSAVELAGIRTAADVLAHSGISLERADLRTQSLVGRQVVERVP